jgi:hypothetical protein
MRTYRFARRSFLRGVGGAVGLKVLLRNLEASAAGATSPPRFLMMHWPVGTIKYHFMPGGSGTNFTFSRCLKPFETAGLKNDMIVIWGLNAGSIGGGQGGGHEAGTPRATTGANCPGTRNNGGEQDDAAAGGPSFDQIFLKNVPALKKDGGAGYVNAICDARVDSLETSTQCLSYGYTTQMIQAARGGTGTPPMITEAVPLLPELSPLQLYTGLFTGFVGGGGTDANRDLVLKNLKMKKSVLDLALDELKEIYALAPASERSKIDLHTQAVRSAEKPISDMLNGTVMPPAVGCVPPTKPTDVRGKTGSRNDYRSTPTTAATADDVVHEQIGKLHAGVIKAAFQCDLLRVATFQWSPGTNHVSFKGLFPDEPNSIYMHHPTTHIITNRAELTESPPTDPTRADIVEFMANVHTWYNQKTADIILDFKNATDAFGGNLLDNTIIPFITEVSEATHGASPKAAMIFGGRKLGMQSGQFANFDTRTRHHNDLWATIAQAYFGTTTPLTNLASEVFVKSGVAPIPGLWVKPA